MEASASSQMEVTATFCPCEAEIPPAPDVACGMVRRARGEKGNKGSGECLPLPDAVRCRPCFPSCRNKRATIPQRTERTTESPTVNGGRSKDYAEHSSNFFQKWVLLVWTRKVCMSAHRTLFAFFGTKNALLLLIIVVFTMLIFNKICIPKACFSNKEFVSLRGLILLRYGRKRNDTS